MPLVATPSQTIGPFFSIGMRTIEIAKEPGTEAFTIQGRVLDGDGNGVNDALIETWQADPDGHYPDGSSRRWRRVATDDSGVFRLSTIMPGRLSSMGDEVHAPHLVVVVFSRGLLRHRLPESTFPTNQRMRLTMYSV
jgi:protocatechuate 3,4-dioxygenase, alpha subunit